MLLYDIVNHPVRVTLITWIIGIILAEDLDALGENARMFVEPQSAKDFRSALRRAGLDPSRVRAPENGLVRVGDIGLEAPVDQMLGYLLGAGWVVPLERRRTKVASPARKPRAAARSTRNSTKS